MLSLFKGELTYTEFMYGMTYKEMMALRDARVNQLLEERKQAQADADAANRENIRNQILA